MTEQRVNITYTYNGVTYGGMIKGDLALPEMVEVCVNMITVTMGFGDPQIVANAMRDRLDELHPEIEETVVSEMINKLGGEET